MKVSRSDLLWVLATVGLGIMWGADHVAQQNAIARLNSRLQVADEKASNLLAALGKRGYSVTINGAAVQVIDPLGQERP